MQARGRSSYGPPPPLQSSSSSSSNIYPDLSRQQVARPNPAQQPSSSAQPPAQQQQQQQQQVAPPPAQPEDPVYGPLSRASKLIGEQLQKDQSLVGEIGEGLQGTSSGNYTIPPSPSFAPFVKAKTHTFPNGLFEEMNASPHLAMGIFPELDRAWMTIDNKLFLWNYNEPADFSRYDEQSGDIVHVGLVRAKPGVFVAAISHLLVVCTSTTIILLGLSLSATDITLYATDLSIPTDGIIMNDVVAMPNGRTFMFGRDGDLYEMQYRADEGWFTKRCSLINWTGSGASGVLGGLVPEFLKTKTEDPIIGLTLDPTRSVIYARTRSNAIVLYLIGPDGTSLTQIARAGDILRTASMLAPSQPALEKGGFEIVNVSAIMKGEGESGAQMVAVTSRGVRLYFSYHRRGYGGVRTTGGSPTALELMHVRFPPSNLTVDAPPAAYPNPSGNGYGQQIPQAPSAPPIRFQSVSENALSSGGIFIGPQRVGDALDILLFTCPDLGRLSQPVSATVNNQSFNSNNQLQQQQYYNSAPSSSAPPTNTRPPLVEQAVAIPLSGQTWAVSEVPHVLNNLAPPLSMLVPGRGELRLNELAAQMGVPPRRFLVLTSEGMHEIRKQRPMDVLKAIFDAGAGSDGGWEVQAFLESYGRDQFCAMCLALASAPEPSSSSLSELVSSAIPGPVSPDSINGAKRAFQELGGRAVKVDRGYGQGPGGSGQSGTQIYFSGRHEGLSIYFARLVRPIWREKITLFSPVPTNPKRQIPNLSEKTLTSVQRDLSALKTFIDANSQLFTSGPASELSTNNSNDRSNEMEAWRAEQTSLNSLVSLVTQAIEALSFVLLLMDYKLPETIQRCQPELQSQFGTLTYQDLLTTKGGRDVASNIVNAVIHQQIGQETSIDAISSTLQQRCGSFCRADDVILFKAEESLRRAKETRDPSERREALAESLRLFAKGTSTLSFEKLKETCADYRSIPFATGAIELPLKCAQDWDSEGQAYGYWNDGERAHDPRQRAFESRKQCYQLVFSTLLAFDELLDQEVARGASSENADSLRANAYNQALSSEDPLFHATLYDWLISRRMTDQLLEIRTPFIESYLSREPLSHDRAELLWQFQVRNGNNAQAAYVQANLAQSLDLPFPLPQRVEYLTLAVSNAKSSSSSSRLTASSVEFLTDLEEKLEVAQVQLEVARTVYEHPDMDQDLKDHLQDQLNARLLTISELYLDFAEPYNLLEITLLILHTSDHRDPALVSKTWRAILERSDAEAETDADKPDAVAAVVVSLGRRFFPSETAFPLEFVCRRLEEYSYINKRDSRPGWVPATLRQAGAEWDRIFDVFYVIFEEKMPPWQSETAVNFLATDIIILIRDWFAEWTRAQASYSQRPSTRFPVLQIEEFITNSLLPCFVSVDDSDSRLEILRGLQRSMRSKI